MEPRHFDTLIETLRHGSDEDTEKAEASLKHDSTREDLPRLEALLLNPCDNYIQDVVAVPYARLEGASGLRVLLQAYQRYLGSYAESEDIQNVLTDIVKSHPTESRRVLQEIERLSDPQLKSNATWLLEYLRAEPVTNPLACAPLEARIVDAQKGQLGLILKELPGKEWRLRFSRVHAYRYLGGRSFRPLTRRDSWIVSLSDSQWSLELLDQGHMHPHPHPGEFVHFHLCALDTTVDVLSSGHSEFEEVRE